MAKLFSHLAIWRLGSIKDSLMFNLWLIDFHIHNHHNTLICISIETDAYQGFGYGSL
jgi:hypothetical protein